MNFHLAFTPTPFTAKINHRERLLLIGSCFTENIGTKLKQYKFTVLENPHGILFNPLSITKSVNAYISNKKYTGADLFYHNECWHSWEHHSRFSHPDKEECLRAINASQQQAHEFLKDAGWIMITFGSAFAYSLYFAENETKENMAGNEGDVVANCHKVPADKFIKKLMPYNQVVTSLHNMLEELITFNPGIKVIFTISPVRHLRDGLVENNRSKATLVQAVHALVDKEKNAFYFPAYELVIDDLRDYRFYAEDLVHPNYAATKYVWEKFVATCIDAPSQKLMALINTINAAKAHKPFNPGSTMHKNFLRLHLEKVETLSEQYPYIDLEDEKSYFETETRPPCPP